NPSRPTRWVPHPPTPGDMADAVMAAAPALVRDTHELMAWVAVIGNGGAGLWALAADRWGEVRHRAMWWFTAAVQAILFVQVALGIWLSDGVSNPHLAMHRFYGFVALFTVVI